MVDNPFVEVAGRKIKLMPDPTPGRARRGAAPSPSGGPPPSPSARKALGIATMEDLRRVSEQLTPLGDRIKASVTPVKTFFTRTAPRKDREWSP